MEWLTTEILSLLLGFGIDTFRGIRGKIKDVNFGDRATLARTFSHTLTAKQPHRHGGQPHL